MTRFTLVIEHLEPCINKWLLKEYEYVASLYGSRLIITNAKNPDHISILSKYAKVYKESIVDILRDINSVVILDPKAQRELAPQELRVANYVIIGGIMGSYPPKGRTWLYITSRLPKATPRNIGPYQYTIAGAAYVLRNIELGKQVSEIKFVYNLKIRKVLSDIEVEVILPYAFPVDDNDNVVLPDDYLNVVTEHVLVYEQRILSSSKNRIC